LGIPALLDSQRAQRPAQVAACALFQYIGNRKRTEKAPRK